MTVPAGETTTPWMTATADIQPFYDGTWADVSTRADEWLTKVLARAKTVAPCFLTPELLPDHVQEAAKGIIIGAVLRLLQDPNGNTQFQSAGMFSTSTDTKLRSDRILSIADRDELKQLCRSAKPRARVRTIRVNLP